MTKVDVLLPYWGDVELLKKTILSVLAQTTQDWRLLIFDDAYPSNEPEEYIQSLNDKRVTYYRHSQNIGITNNFNYALEAAEADYCVMLGCDDILLPNYLEVAIARIGEADFYQPGVDVIDAEGTVYRPLGDRIKRIIQPRKAGIYKGERLAVSLCRGNWLYFPSILWKTSTIKRYRFDPKYKIAEDVVVELDIIKDGGSLYLDKSTTFHYRRFANSLSSREKTKGGVRFNEESEVYHKFATTFREMGWKRASRAAQLRITSRMHELIS